MAKQTTENASENGTAQALGMGDIGMIRNILMGQQMSQIEERFRQIDARQDASAADLQSQIRQLESAANQRLGDLERRIDERLSALEKRLDEQVNRLNERIAETSRADRRQIGLLLAEMGQKLAEA